MPVYEFRCNKCNKIFSIQIKVFEYEKSKSHFCPECKSKDVRRIFSQFTAVTSKKS
jgi:putative FmdB family regulatory protein